MCTVRQCGGALQRQDRRLLCANGHSYDIARSGYVNLLQPQDRRSARPGDSRESVDARAGLFDSGVGVALIHSLTPRVLAHAAPSDRPSVVVDLGCGSGELLGAIARDTHVCGVGIDISTAAITRAARRFPRQAWVIANADRGLPILDGSVDVVTSMHARRNPPECHRVLRREGVLLVAVPAPDDLLELREGVLGERVVRDRTEALLAEHAELFDVLERWTVRDQRQLERPALVALLRGTYRGKRFSEAARVVGLDRMVVTLASDCVLFSRRA